MKSVISYIFGLSKYLETGKKNLIKSTVTKKNKNINKLSKDITNLNTNSQVSIEII